MIEKHYGKATRSDELGVFVDCNLNSRIPDWADGENPFHRHIPCGMVDLSKISTESVFLGGEKSLTGEVFTFRAQELNSLNACAFDFFSAPANWKYLRHLRDDLRVLVFPGTIFNSDGQHYMRCLCRDGDACWGAGKILVDRLVSDECQVAVFA